MLLANALGAMSDQTGILRVASADLVSNTAVDLLDKQSHLLSAHLRQHLDTLRPEYAKRVGAAGVISQAVYALKLHRSS